MIDKSDFKLNRVISPETKYMYLMDAMQEAELVFLPPRKTRDATVTARSVLNSSVPRSGPLTPVSPPCFPQDRTATVF
jgi:hypothetical protein